MLGALPRLEAFAFLFFLLCLDMILYDHSVQRRRWVFVLGGRWMTKQCEGGMICGRYLKERCVIGNDMREGVR